MSTQIDLHFIRHPSNLMLQSYLRNTNLIKWSTNCFARNFSWSDWWKHILQYAFLFRRGALRYTRNRKTEEKFIQNRKTANKIGQNRKPHTKLYTQIGPNRKKIGKTKNHIGYQNRKTSIFYENRKPDAKKWKIHKPPHWTPKPKNRSKKCPKIPMPPSLSHRNYNINNFKKNKCYIVHYVKKERKEAQPYPEGFLD